MYVFLSGVGHLRVLPSGVTLTAKDRGVSIGSHNFSVTSYIPTSRQVRQPTLVKKKIKERGIKHSVDFLKKVVRISIDDRRQMLKIL